MTNKSIEQHPTQMGTCTNEVDRTPTRNKSFHDHGQTECKRNLERQACLPGLLRSKTVILYQKTKYNIIGLVFVFG